MPFATHDGQELWYEDTGSGPAVVFSHGFFMDGEMFAAQVAHLSPSVRCVTWDARGLGRTRSDGRPFTYWDAADDLAAVLDDAGIDRAVLVGMSQGGFTSQRFALRYPERTAGLVLIDTDAVAYDEPTREAYRAGKEHFVANGWTDEYVGQMAGILFGPGFDSTPWTDRWRAIDPPGLSEPFETMITRDDLRGRLGEIGCPALVVHGELDASIPLQSAHELAAALPGAGDVAVVAGAGHSSNVEQPDAVNLLLDGFLLSAGWR